MPFCNADAISYFIDKARDCSNPYEARAWLLTASSIAPTIFQIQLEAYALEKRLENAEGAANHFITLFRKFMNCLDEEIAELGNAVRNHHMNKGKETPEQLFLLQVFAALPKEIQMEVLMQRSEHTTIIYEKCQFMLLLVKLYPDTVDAQGVGADLLYNVLGCESDVFSTFRSLLVNELVPAVLQLSKNLAPSKRLITLLNQCIEYYTMVPDPLLAGRSEDYLELTAKRWDQLFGVVDQIGFILSWKISPFFSSTTQNAPGTVESMFHSLSLAFQHKSHYSASELAYVSLVVFLRCLVTSDQLASYASSNFGAPSKLTLVEVFYPQRNKTLPADSPAPVMTTVSQNYTVSTVQASINSYFITAVKLWQIITNNGNVRGDRIEKEVRSILFSMKSLHLEFWPVFQKFLVDFRLYTGQRIAGDSQAIEHPLKRASLLCSINDFQGAAEAALKAIENLQREGTTFGDTSENLKMGSLGASSAEREDLSFFNYQHGKEKLDFSVLRRFHFISEDRYEVIYYVANVLIRCLNETMNSSHDELCIGHLLTLLQLEWPSPAAELVMNHIVDVIRARRRFSYYPFFAEFVIEPDFLETFMFIGNYESKTVALDLFPSGSGTNGTASRRMATRGVDKGAKNEFKQAMKRQMMKNDGTIRIENLVHRFFSLHSSDLLLCLPSSKSDK